MDPQTQAVLARARGGDIGGAIKAGEALLARGGGDGAFAMFIGMLCCRQGDLERGIPHLRRAADVAPNEPGVRVELARALIAAGENEEAMAIAAPLASPASPLGREMQRIRARGLLATGDAGAAVTLYAPLTAADAADFESWDGLGMARLTTGDVSGAVTALRQAIELRPNAVPYLINFARAAIAAADFNAAQNAAARAVTLAPGDPAAHFAQARAFAGQRRYEPALASLASARAAAPATPELLSEAAEIEVNCRAFAAAEETYRAALALRADLPQGIGLA
jgi:Flp pilus assembly protein TadD